MKPPNPKLVMSFYEEPEHLRIILHHPTGAKTVWLAKEDAEQLVKFIGAKHIPIKPETLVYARR